MILLFLSYADAEAQRRNRQREPETPELEPINHLGVWNCVLYGDEDDEEDERVVLNFGIAMAARIPMMTTTISSSTRVNPDSLLVMCGSSLGMESWLPETKGGPGDRPDHPRASSHTRIVMRGLQSDPWGQFVQATSPG